jgi:hypothetical protein
LLPPIPEKLWRIDESTVGQHFLLRATDRCYYVWEYTAGKGYDFSPTNNLISNLKTKPTQIAKTPKRNFWKQQAINHSASALRQLLGQAFVEQRATFIPVPGSKAAGDPDYDDRVLEVLRRAFQGWAADVRPILELTRSTRADHESGERLSYDEFLAITRLNDPSGRVPRSVVVIVDDVLTSGKHFKVGQNLISARYSGVEIRGLFLARCIHDDVSSPDEFPIVYTD